MTMKNVGDAENLRAFQHGTAEQRIALGIVWIVACGRSIKRLAVKIFGTLHKVKSHPRLTPARNHRRETILVVEGHSDAADHRRRVGELGLTVARKIDAD